MQYTLVGFRTPGIAAGLGLFLSLGGQQAPAAPFYTITDLGTDFSPAAISDAGVIVGDVFAAAPNTIKTWSASDGFVDLLPHDSISGSDGFASADINTSGAVLATAYYTSGGEGVVLYKPGSGWSDTGISGNGEAINDAGDFVGSYTDGARTAFLYSGDEFTDLGTLGTPGYSFSEALDLNDNGQVVGRSEIDTIDGDRAFIWDADQGMVSLGVLGEAEGFPRYSGATGINADGEVVGKSESQAFIWDAKNGMVDIGRSSSDTSIEVSAINDSGVVVGYAEPEFFGEGFIDAADTAVVYDAADGWQDLFSLVLDPTGWLGLSGAIDINSDGAIVGLGRRDSGGAGLSAFLLTPAEPGSTPDNPLLPNPEPDPETGAWEFADVTVDPGQWTFFDPLVAIGYDYMVESGPNIAGVTLPEVGDNLFELFLWNGVDWVLETGSLAANTEYEFDGGGVDRFRILGIEVDALLDPADPEAFVTGLDFVSAGTVNLTQTPITTFVASAPATPLLVATAVLALGWRRRLG